MNVFGFASGHLRINSRKTFSGTFVVAVHAVVFGSGSDGVIFLQAAGHLNTQLCNKERRFA